MKQFGLVLVIGVLFEMSLPVPACGRGEQSLQSTDANIKIIRVKGASASETARALDEAFNSSGTEQKARIVVFAIPTTKYLFVMATSDDLKTITELLKPL